MYGREEGGPEWESKSNRTYGGIAWHHGRMVKNKKPQSEETTNIKTKWGWVGGCLKMEDAHLGLLFFFFFSSSGASVISTPFISCYLLFSVGCYLGLFFVFVFCVDKDGSVGQSNERMKWMDGWMMNEWIGWAGQLCGIH